MTEFFFQGKITVYKDDDEEKKKKFQIMQSRIEHKREKKIIKLN